MHLIDTELVLQANINLNYLKLTGTSSIQTNTKTFLRVILKSEQTMSGLTMQSTVIRESISGDSTITTSGDLLVNILV
jgi:hypothetical protein